MKTPIYGIPRKEVVKVVHEFQVPASVVAPDGYLAVVFYNDPVNDTTVIFPQEDGFEVLYKAGTFGTNYVRAVLLVFARLVFFAVLGVSLSTWLGFPVAVLCSLAFFFTGVINGFIVDVFDMGFQYRVSIRFQQLDYPENFGGVIFAKAVYFINDGIPAVFTRIKDHFPRFVHRA